MSDTLGPIDQAVVDLLKSGREAAEQEIVDNAQALHDAALADDERLTVAGQLGAEVVALYADFETREQYFIRACTKPFSLGLLRKRGLSTYAAHISETHEVTEDVGLKIAESELHRREYMERMSKQIKRLKGHNYTVHQHTSYRFIAPFYDISQVEQVSESTISQRLRVEAEVPFMNQGIVYVSHEAVDHDRSISQKTTMFAVHLELSDVPNTICSDSNLNRLSEGELFLPLGIIHIARLAVRESVPNKVFKDGKIS